MKFIIIHNFSELTGIGGIGNGPDMALGSIPVTRRKKKKIKVEFIAARRPMPALRKLGAPSLGMSTGAQPRKSPMQAARPSMGIKPMRKIHKPFGIGKKPRFSGVSQQQGSSRNY